MTGRGRSWARGGKGGLSSVATCMSNLVLRLNLLDRLWPLILQSFIFLRKSLRLLRCQLFIVALTGRQLLLVPFLDDKLLLLVIPLLLALHFSLSLLALLLSLFLFLFFCQFAN